MFCTLHDIDIIKISLFWSEALAVMDQALFSMDSHRPLIGNWVTGKCKGNNGQEKNLQVCIESHLPIHKKCVLKDR